MLEGVPIADEGLFTTPIDPYGIAISPDGAWVGMLYQRAGQYRLGVFATAGDERPREMALPCGRPGGLTWSPDGKAVAFYADCPDSQEGNIWVLRLGTGAIFGVIKEPGWYAWISSWSPDSTLLAFSAYPVPRKPGDGELPRLFLASLPKGEVKQITGGEYIDSAPQFSPDGRSLVHRRGWDTWLHCLADGSERQLITEHGHDFAPHRGCFSPDGTQIVIQRGMVDGGQIIIVDIATGEKRALTDASNTDVRPSWSPSGNTISFVRNRERVVVAGLDGTVLWEAAPSNGRVLTGYSAGTQWAEKAEVLAFLDGDGNAWVAGPGVPTRQLTRFAEQPKVDQQPRDVTCPSTGGVEVPALLLEPKGFEPGQSPAVVWVHGGPTATAASGLRNAPVSHYLNALLDAGFLVIMPDYRGSTGHGEAWEWVRPHQRGIVDVDDIVAAKDFVEKNGLAARGKVAVAGYSFGGYLSLMALCRSSENWACAASLWGLVDPRWLRVAWEADPRGHDPLPDLSRQTPLNFLHQARSPLLILHGTQDVIATVEQVEAAREAVRSNGTPCDVHLFKDTHGLPLHTDEAAELLISFLKQHTSDQGRTTP